MILLIKIIPNVSFYYYLAAILIILVINTIITPMFF